MRIKKKGYKLGISIFSFFFLVLTCIGFFQTTTVQSKAPTVVINPGHSIGYDSGAVNGSTGVTEAQVNASVSKRLAEKLRDAGYDVYLTHPVSGCSVPHLMSASTASSLSSLSAGVRAKNPDLVLSIHHNSGGGSASGYELYWSSYKPYVDQSGIYQVSGLWSGGALAYRDSTPSSAAIRSRDFCNNITKSFSGSALPYRKTVERDDHLPANTACPAVLYEGGFISNNSESQYLNSSAYHEDASNRLINAINDFYGGAPVKDTTAPKGESVTNEGTPTTDTIFTTYANGVTDNSSGVKEVKFAVWTAKNGQDDIIWYNGQSIGNNRWKCSANYQNHNKELGTYYVHVYAYDYAGNIGFVGSTTVELKKLESAAGGISVTNVSAAGFKVMANGYSQYSKLYFPTWSDAGGQDDIVWYEGVPQTDGKTSAVTILASNHKNDVGNYSVHIYGVDSNGKMIGLGAKTVTVPQMTATSVTAGSVSNGKFTVTVNGIKAPAGVKQILLPTWSANNGQDDIKWYVATKKNDTTYTYTVDIKNHGYDVGTYNVHAYGVDNNNKTVGIGATTVSVPQMTATSVTAGSVSNGKFTVTVNGIKAPAGVKQIMLPTWSANNGQDDIKWYIATKKNDTTYTYTVDIKNHGYDVGSYNVHAYGLDNNNKMVIIGTSTVSVPQMTATGVTAGSVSNGKFTVTVNGIKAPAGVKQILLPTWSANNGQDDIVWYIATKKNDTTYTYTVDIKNHGYDVGSYNVHAYGLDNNNKMVIIGTSTVSVPQMTATGVTTGSVSNGKFTVTVNGIKAPAGVKQILLPTWSANNGQDDIRWYEAAKKNDTTYTFTVDTKNHGNDIGTYNVHAYGVDSNNKMVYIGKMTVNISHQPMTIAKATASSVTNGKYTIEVSGISAPHGVKSIQLPTWVDGKQGSTIVWYEAVKVNDTTYRATVEAKNHGYHTGNYVTHVYGTDGAGVQKSYMALSTNVPHANMTTTSVTAGAKSNGTFKVTISGINAPFGVDNIVVPIWSEINGQDDIKWYPAGANNDGSYTAVATLANHGNNTGTYQCHVYGTDKTGKQIGIGATAISIQSSDLSNSQYTSIMGSSTKNSSQLAALYRNQSPQSFPSHYTNRGVSLETFAQMYAEECAAEGVRAEVAFSQAMLETGYLRFGGQVSINQLNFAGIGATDGGAGGEDFRKYGDNATGIRMGIRAQVQHLKAYASTDALRNACVDPRFNLVKRGSANYVEWLGQKENPNGYGWATGQNYGQKILTIMNLI